MGDGLGSDIQGGIPSTRLALSRVGVTGIKRVIRLKNASREDGLFFAAIDLYAHLDANQSGVHMSRFIENIDDALAQAAREPSPGIETLTDHMALAIAKTQTSARAEARIRAQCPMTRRAPVSGAETEDLYTFIGVSVSDGKRTRRAAGIELNGLTVCPCAREMVAERSRAKLLEAGYTDAQAREITSILPLASHNQRGLGTLIIGSDHTVKTDALIGIAERSMSSRIYELLKRPDELSVVWGGHMKPRFVEDVVREMLRDAIETLTYIPDDAFIMARQENFESIHAHNACAERSARFGEIRKELGGAAYSRSGGISLDAWLNQPF
jgi:GTP cyclohydrolase-4